MARRIFCGLIVALACLNGQRSDDPDLLWKKLKQALLSPGGNKYYQEGLKNALVPTLYGTLVASSPKEHPSEFLVAMPGSDVPDLSSKEIWRNPWRRARRSLSMAS